MAVQCALLQDGSHVFDLADGIRSRIIAILSWQTEKMC